MKLSTFTQNREGEYSVEFRFNQDIEGYKSAIWTILDNDEIDEIIKARPEKLQDLLKQKWREFEERKSKIEKDLPITPKQEDIFIM